MGIVDIWGINIDGRITFKFIIKPEEKLRGLNTLKLKSKANIDLWETKVEVNIKMEIKQSLW
jgi:hypothetical protein